ncbi:DUF6415 family natural product biosynthesis protein [Streptomyces diacarni]|uniref:DUF6415 family natural product biosynthesis protein n=1 Tax=Streptomyces diacarni TaxID=2800381 RepID=UPI0033CED088
MTAPGPGLPKRERRDLYVEPARKPPVAAVRTAVRLLHNWFIEDEEIDDALDMVMGKESALLTPDELEELLPRIRKHLDQLVRIAAQRFAGAGSPELAAVVVRSRQLSASPVPVDFPSARGHARHLAFLTVDVLEVLADEEEVVSSDRRCSA